MVENLLVNNMQEAIGVIKTTPSRFGRMENGKEKLYY